MRQEEKIYAGRLSGQLEFLNCDCQKSGPDPARRSTAKFGHEIAKFAIQARSIVQFWERHILLHQTLFCIRPVGGTVVNQMRHTLDRLQFQIERYGLSTEELERALDSFEAGATRTEAVLARVIQLDTDNRMLEALLCALEDRN